MYNNGTFANSKHLATHLSDGLRMAYIYKVVKNLSNSPGADFNPVSYMPSMEVGMQTPTLSSSSPWGECKTLSLPLQSPKRYFKALNIEGNIVFYISFPISLKPHLTFTSQMASLIWKTITNWALLTWKSSKGSLGERRGQKLGPRLSPMYSGILDKSVLLFKTS